MQKDRGYDNRNKKDDCKWAYLLSHYVHTMLQGTMFPPPITLEDHEHNNEEYDGKSKALQIHE